MLLASHTVSMPIQAKLVVAHNPEWTTHVVGPISAAARTVMIAGLDLETDTNVGWDDKCLPWFCRS